jgi:hypothetical protein
MKKCTLFHALLALPLFFSVSARAQTLQKASGGAGAYKESIHWLDFATAGELAAGDVDTYQYVIDDLYTLVVIISDITFDGVLADSVPLSQQRLTGYASGTYGGDGLVMLYNKDVPNDGLSHSDRNKNTLFNALAFKYDGSYSGYPNEAKANFKIKAYAYLNATNDPIDVGLIFADAETDEPNPAWPYEEYSQGTTNGSPWQIFETAIYDPTGYQQIEIFNDGQTARTICGFYDEVFRPGNVALMYTKHTNTTVDAPLDVDIELKGGGKSAIAIGFLLTGTDRGDAPASYGNPENIFFTTIIGGTPPSDGTYYISTEGDHGGENVIPVGVMDYLQTPRLGNIAGDPDNYGAVTTFDAMQDNFSGVDDEDALTTVPSLTTRDNLLSITFNATPTPGQEAYINAWFDANTNGLFDPSEFLTTTIDNVADVSFDWSELTLGAGPTYLRLRIQSNVPGTAEGAANVKMGGETEDYLINVTTFISGNIFHDANGLSNPDATVNGTLIDTASGQQLYISLLDNEGNLIAQVPVNPDGSYELGNISIGNYTAVLTFVENGTTASLPQGWVNTGEHIGNTPGSDGNANGVINLTINQGDPELTQVNFGIQLVPDTDPHFTLIPQPSEGDTLIIGQGLLPALSGSDPEDGEYLATSGTLQNPQGIVITSLPTNGTLYYQGAPVSVNQVLIDFAPGDLIVVLDGEGFTGIEFTYAYIDAAGAVDPTPAVYEIAWEHPLPVQLLGLTANLMRDQVQLLWTTTREQNNKWFVVERSDDGQAWQPIGRVVSQATQGNSTASLHYTYTDAQPLAGDNFYRLQQVDIDGAVTYSAVVSVSLAPLSNISVYPNPTVQQVQVQGLAGTELIQVINSLGVTVHTVQAGSNNAILNLEHLPAGTYYLRVLHENTVVHNQTLLKL